MYSGSFVTDFSEVLATNVFRNFGKIYQSTLTHIPGVIGPNLQKEFMTKAVSAGRSKTQVALRFFT
jgi:hypothetical protein